ncbi:MAG: hypothetical protein A3J69_02010 [Candidatus Levybacteria bacterium RIFCSPHIGHO2_02_FULL_42_12]|nr:MAG: hypothetical protein A3J69_02010 [Candidatus Levybacteria bacterium RIFCSPHIGHO2_02_FULL_42_12]OGH42915.1 MAG: hypothetical protein A3B53_03340 [Candidatus Levybacteria bacterium RIFCSPLOWO2_01_FULL_42_15]
MFVNRREAGRLLAVRLSRFRKTNAVVIGIPRGGMEVACEISSLLKLPLDIAVVKKISSQSNPELAIGAVGPKRTLHWDYGILKKIGIFKETQSTQLEFTRLKRDLQEKSFKTVLPRISLAEKIALLVDDGVATGATVLCAQIYLKKQKAARIILAVPVISKETLRNIKKHFDSVIALSIEKNFYAVGQFYEEFEQVTDEKVMCLLRNGKMQYN